MPKQFLEWVLWRKSARGAASSVHVETPLFSNRRQLSNRVLVQLTVIYEILAHYQVKLRKLPIAMKQSLPADIAELNLVTRQKVYDVT